VAKTKALKKSPFMGQTKAKNRHVSFGNEPRLARAASSFSALTPGSTPAHDTSQATPRTIHPRAPSLQPPLTRRGLAIPTCMVSGFHTAGSKVYVERQKNSGRVALERSVCAPPPHALVTSPAPVRVAAWQAAASHQ